jgi:small subunit ribosomal protein S9
MTDQETPDTPPTDAANEPTPDAPVSETTEAAPETPAPADTAAAATPAAAPPAAPAPAPTTGRAPSNGTWWWGTGRRKSAVARVRLRPGTGSITVNKKPYDQFFTGERDRKDLTNVLEKTRTTGTLDVHVNVRGGGFTGQAGAIVLGLARALHRYDGTLEPILRDNNFLTRDPREVERKKYGQPGARARFQFSKR